MKLMSLVVVSFCSLAVPAFAGPPTSQKAAPASLEVRAMTAFTNGQYAMALPMLQKLQTEYQGQPDKLGPLAEKIKVCETQIQQAGVVNGTAAAPPVALGAEREPHAKPKPGEVLSLEIKDLGNFDYDADKGGNIPADVVALSGTKIKLHGFMIPIDQAESITQFALVPSLFACCFGQPPQVQHTIVCKAPSGKAVSYYPDELTIEGKLKVEEKKDEGFIVSVFEVDVSSVKPAAK
jgi:hypothetical protein